MRLESESSNLGNRNKKDYHTFVLLQVQHKKYDLIQKISSLTSFLKTWSKEQQGKANDSNLGNAYGASHVQIQQVQCVY